MSGEIARAAGASVDSYRRLADTFRFVLSEHGLDALLERIADIVSDLVPYDFLTIYEADEQQRILNPVLSRDDYAELIMGNPTPFDVGITGWAASHREPVLANRAHLDPRCAVVPGTPADDPEALITIPLVARGSVHGALNLYRIGETAHFTDEEFELAKRFGDAAALALDNAHIRAALEHQAQTDALTGLYNHRYFHERLRSELTRASRTHDAVALVMFDIDDFKKINDVHGHGTGDHILQLLAETLKSTVRASDIVCRLGGEEFAIIMPSCDAGDAFGLARRVRDRLELLDFDPAGKITLSVGIAQGPDHAMNPRELLACADAAMLTAKAKGKNRVVLFDESTSERPGAPSSDRDVRSIAHLKMLQSLAGKLNRLNDVREIASAITNELRTLIDYHSCRVYVTEGDSLVPVSWRGELEDDVNGRRALACKVGEGITGRAALTGKAVLVANALDCPYAVTIAGTDDIEESVIAVPLCHGVRVIGVIVVSKLGSNQLDGDDVRLLEVLAGQASIALENARLYEEQRREAHNAKALLEFADSIYNSPSLYSIGQRTVEIARELLEATHCALWMESERSRDFHCMAHAGYVGDPETEAVVRARVAAADGARLLNERREPFVLGASECEDYFEKPPEVVLRDVAIAPLHRSEGVRGWIVVALHQEEPSHFTDARLRLLAGLSYHTSVAMQRAILYRDQKESAEVANALLEFSGALASAATIDEVLDRIVEQAARILGSPKALVMLQEGETGDVVPEAAWGFTEAERRSLAVARYGESDARRVLGRSEPFMLGAEDFECIPGLDDIVGRLTCAIAPLAVDEGRIGCILVTAPAFGDYEFSERKIRLLAGIAHQAKLGLANVGSFESLERTFVSTVEALANALEAKDEYTSSHAREITDMALEVGHRLGMDIRSLKRLELGALFHDIGKIGIPSAILCKAGPLDDEEWEIIKTHPELGERILGPIDRLTEVRPIVRHCHERYDGGGYPDGKAGADIPIESRIIFVCDAFHAMTTDRPYRDALPAEEAARRLREGAGTQFDPNVVDAFLALLQEQSSAA
ncbi:MAG TPA: GAF domain-containing protein [Actinomycetota bacterium]|nr:GAF domain-containing protein [Actinomycetota bacterium]